MSKNLTIVEITECELDQLYLGFRHRGKELFLQEAKIKELEAKNVELEEMLTKQFALVSDIGMRKNTLEKKLEIAVEALKVVGWHCSDDGSHDPDEMYDVVDKALKAIKDP